MTSRSAIFVTSHLKISAWLRIRQRICQKKFQQCLQQISLSLSLFQTAHHTYVLPNIFQMINVNA